MSQRNLKHQTKSGLYWTFLNQFANYGMQFVIGIIMARMLSPSDYGITALPVVFISIAGAFVDSGFANALVRKPDLTEKDLSTSFYYSMIVGSVCYLLLFVGAPWISAFYNTPVLEQLLRVTAISFLWAPLATPQRVILSRRLDFKTPTKISIITRLLGGICGVLLAYVGYGLWALVISDLVAGFIAVLMNWYVVRWIPKAPWSKDSFIYLWGFGNKLMLSGLIDTAYKNVTPIFIGKYYSAADLGVYNRALGYANMPSQNFTFAIRSVTFPVLSKMQNDDETLARNYRRMLRAVCFVVFPMMIVLASLAYPLVVVILTEKWVACVPILQILCFAQMWYPVDAINLNLLQVKGRSDLFLRLEVIKKIIGFSIIMISLPFGIIYFCYGCVVYSVLEIMIDSYYTGKLINYGFLKQIGDLLPSLSLSLIVFGVLFWGAKLMPFLPLQIILGFVIAMIIYVGISVLFNFPEIEDVRYMLNRKK